MKTWTNPTVEELEVTMTADGWRKSEIEQLPWMPDYNWLTDKEKTPS